MENIPSQSAEIRPQSVQFISGIISARIVQHISDKHKQRIIKRENMI